jgi:hypothetical protein
MKKVGKAVFGAAKKAAKAVVKAVKTVAKYVKKGVQWVGGKAKGVFQKIAKSKIGKAIVAAVKKGVGAIKKVIAKVKGWIEKGKKKWREWREKRKKKREERKKRLQAKLEEIVGKIGPDLSAFLAGGASRLRLWGHLRLLQAKHLLTWLTWRKDGSFEARLNPKMPVPGVKGKRIADSELGRLLLPVFESAERDYEAHLQADPVANAAMQQAVAGGAAKTPRSLEGLTDFEQGRVVQAPSRAAGKRNVLKDVDLWAPKTGGVGKVEYLRKYAEDAAKGKPGMIEGVLGRAAQFGVSPDELRTILAGPAATREASLKMLSARLSVGATSKGDLASRDVFGRELKRVGFLTQSFEIGRMGGLPTATATSATLLAAGKVELPEVFSSSGRFAPHTPVGASPESGVAATPEQLAAGRVRERRVGAIFRTLMQTATHTGIIVNAGGYDLANLVSALELFLTERLKHNPTPEALASAANLLRAELKAMLIAYHGR